MTDQPGELIRDAIANGPTGLSQKTVARRVGVSEKHLSFIVLGKARLTADLALRLESHLAVSAEDLLVAQALRDLTQARASALHTEGASS